MKSTGLLDFEIMYVQSNGMSKITLRVLVFQYSQSAPATTSTVISQRRAGVKLNKVFLAD